jgi:cytochrome c2
VTGQPDDIKAINAKFGDRSAERSLSTHRNEILIGNDATGDWQRDSAFNDVSQLVMTVRLMNPAFHNQPSATEDEIAGDPGTMRLSDQPGQALFRRMCTPCHTIGGGRRVGPDLKGVADRRSHDWLVDFIMSPANMLARKDPDALALVAGFPGVKMPSIGLGKTDAEGLISYLRQETSRSSAIVQSSNALK